MELERKAEFTDIAERVITGILPEILPPEENPDDYIVEVKLYRIIDKEVSDD